MATSSTLRWFWFATLVCAFGLAAVPGRAEEPKEQPAQKTAKSQAPAEQKNSLASVAAHIKLRRVSETDAPIVISNSNLSELAQRGVISVGSGATGTESDVDQAPADQGAQTPPFDAKAWEQKVKEQEQKVTALQKAYDGFDENVRKSSDPHFGYGAYNVAPGQVSPAVVAKQDLQKKLEDAKKELDALQAEGKKQGTTP